MLRKTKEDLISKPTVPEQPVPDIPITSNPDPIEQTPQRSPVKVTTPKTNTPAKTPEKIVSYTPTRSHRSGRTINLPERFKDCVMYK